MLQLIPDEELSKEQLIKLLNSHRKMLYRYVSEIQLYHALSLAVENIIDVAKPADAGQSSVLKSFKEKVKDLLYDYERSQNFTELPEMTVKYEESVVSSAG